MTHARTPARQRRSRKETARLGIDIYERDIRKQVESDHHGEIIAIDVESGDWAIADSVINARERLHAQRPNAVDVLFERIGYRTLYSFGGGSLQGTE